MENKISTLCYVRDNGKTLMMHRIKKENDIHEGKWNGLGGKLEYGESPDDCSIREVKEESGLNVIEQKMKGMITFTGFAPGEVRYVYIYVIDKFSGKLIDDCNEGELCWIDDNKLFDLNLWDGDKVFLKWLDNNGFFSAKFNYDNGEFLDYKVNFY